MRVDDGQVLFVNWDKSRRQTYFDRKYPNAIRADGDRGLSVTWWPPKKFDEARLSEPLHLFGRRGRSPFLYLGRLAYVGPLDDGPPDGLLLRLADADDAAGAGDAAVAAGAVGASSLGVLPGWRLPFVGGHASMESRPLSLFWLVATGRDSRCFTSIKCTVYKP